MKYCIVIIDGAAGLPLPERGGKTCLELACTPNLDAMAEEGLLGLVRTVPLGMEASSACACMSVLGYDPQLYYRGRAAIEAGASLVMGHHPHRLQAIEICKGQPIFYSLGNFAFDWEKMRGRNQEGILIKCRIRDKMLDRVSFIPVRRNDENLVEPLNPNHAPGRDIVAQLRDLSEPYRTQCHVEGIEVLVKEAAK